MGDEKQFEETLAPAWKMPEPIFRSSPGKGPKNLDLTQEEIPTEPGFSEMETEETVAIPPELDDTDPGSPQGVRPSTKVRVRHKKKGGCLRSLAAMVALFAVVGIAVIVILVYWLNSYFSGRGPF